MPEFLPGLQLSELFYREVVGPMLQKEFPELVHSAGLLGYGSDVLGFDDPRSTDHEWGPRVLIFLSEADRETYAAPIFELLRWQLPPIFRGYSTHFAHGSDDFVRSMADSNGRPVEHKVEVLSVPGFFAERTGLDVGRDPTCVDWLATPQQRLLEVTAGKVFHDGLGQLESARNRLAYYPRDVWLLLLAAQWQRISQIEAFVGRTAETGDILGSRLIAASLVHDLMFLTFLIERRYAPYPKWFGTGFARLNGAADLGPILEEVLAAATYPERELALVRAYALVVAWHNALALTPPRDTRATDYWGRPFKVIHAENIARDLVATIQDPVVRTIAERHGRALFGSVDQIADSTDVLSYPEVFARLRALYE